MCVCIYIYICTHPSLHPSIPPSLHPSMPPSLHPSLPPSLRPSLRPSVHPSLPPSITYIRTYELLRLLYWLRSGFRAARVYAGLSFWARLSIRIAMLHEEHMGVSATLNSRILIIRTPKIRYPLFSETPTCLRSSPQALKQNYTLVV